MHNSPRSFNLSWYHINKHFLHKIRSCCLISVFIALCWVGGLTPLSVPAHVWWWGGMEIMLMEMSPSLSGLALAARLNKLKILLKGDRSSQNTINNFKMPFQEPAWQFGACRLGLSCKESVSKHIELKSRHICQTVGRSISCVPLAEWVLAKAKTQRQKGALSFWWFITSIWCCRGNDLRTRDVSEKYFCMEVVLVPGVAAASGESQTRHQHGCLPVACFSLN